MSLFSYSELKEKASTYEPAELCGVFGFDNSVDIACDILHNGEWDEALHQYAVELLEELRKTRPETWNSTWRYDGLLGYAYDIVLNFDERFAAFKRAFDKASSPPPPELLVALARCYFAPDPPNVTKPQAIELVRQSIKNVLYIEAVGFLKGVYKSLGNIEEQTYWEGVYEKIEETGVHLPPLDEIPRGER